MKNYRILRIYATAPYQKIYTQFYQENGLASVSYQQAVQQLCKYGYIIPGHWSDCMKKLGNESIDLLPDFPLLQKKWAQENQVSLDPASAQIPFLLKQIEIIKPDVLFFYAGGWSMIPDELRRNLKNLYPFIKVITGLWGDPLPANEGYSKFKDVDVLFCAYKHNVEGAQQQGIRATLNGNCFDPQFASVLAGEEPSLKYDFIFAGSSGYGFADHINRYKAIVQLIQQTGLEIWCFEPNVNKKLILRNFIRDSMTKTLASLPSPLLRSLESVFAKPNSLTKQLDKWANRLLRSQYENRTLRMIQEALKPQTERYGQNKWDLSNKPIKELFPQNCHSPLFGLDYFRLMKHSKIVFNCHSSDAVHAGNIRMFEVTGLGSCLMTDNPEECKHLFQLDEEIVAYSSIDECVEKVNYLLRHEEKRKAIAEKGRKRTFNEHTVMHRCAVIHESLQSLL
jgi:spore maturation protein CgeB